MTKLNLLKRICAGVLTFVMVGTSIQVNTYALEGQSDLTTIDDVEKSEDVQEELLVDDKTDIEDEIEDAIDAVDDAPVKEAVIQPDTDSVSTHTVNITLENISSINYVFAEDPDEVSYNESGYVTGQMYYEKTNLAGATSVSIVVPENNYLFIVGITKTESTYCSPIVKYDNYVYDYNDGTDSDNIIGRYNDTKHTVIKGYRFGTRSGSTVSIDKVISIKSKKLSTVNIGIENISSVKYVIAENINDVVGDDIVDSINLAEKTTLTLKNVPAGYSVCILKIEKKYDAYTAPIVTGVQESTGTVETKEGKSFTNSYIYVADGNDVESDAFTIKSFAQYKATIGVSGIESFKYALVDSVSELPLDLSGCVEKDDISSESSVEISNIKTGKYLVIFDIESEDEENSPNIALLEGDSIKSITSNLGKIGTEYYDGYYFKITGDINNISISSSGNYCVSIKYEGIRSISYVAAKELNKVNEADIVTKTITSEMDNPLVVSVPSGYALVITSVERISDRYEFPVVTLNGINQTQKTVGKMKRNDGTTVDLEGYIVAANISQDITSGIIVSSTMKSYKVSVTTTNAIRIGYAYATDEEKLQQTIKAAWSGIGNSDTTNGEYFAKWEYVTDGKTSQIDVPAGYYFAIFKLVENKWCHGSTEVYKGTTPISKKTFNEGDDEYSYWSIGTVNTNITGLKAKIVDEYYDVNLDFESVSAFRYIICSNLSGVEKNSDIPVSLGVATETPDYDVKVDADDETKSTVTIKGIPKGRYLVITEITKIDAGTPIADNVVEVTALVDGSLVTKEKGYADIGRYSDATTFKGWSIGSITAPYPVCSYNSKDDTYTPISNYINVESLNHCMDISLKSAANVSMAYVDGYISKSNGAGGLKYYTNIAWNDDKSGIIADDLKVKIVSKSVDYAINSKTKVLARFFRKTTEGLAVYSDAPVELDYISDSVGEFILEKSKIESAATDADNKWTSVEINVIPQIVVTVPTEDDDKVEVFRYDASKTSVAEYEAADDLKIKNGGTSNAFYFGDTLKFVVFPIEAYRDNYALDTIKEKSGVTVEKFTDSNHINYFQISTMKKNMELDSSLKTLSNAIELKLKNLTETIDGGKYGTATVISDHVTKKGNKDSDGFYTYSVNQGVVNVIFTIKESNSHAGLKFYLCEESEDPTDADLVEEDKRTDAGVYTFTIPVEKLKGQQIILENDWEFKDFYVQYNAKLITPTIKCNSEVFPVIGERESQLDGYKIYHYRLPFDANAEIYALPKDNCKVEYALVDGYKRTFDSTGKYTYKIKKSNDSSGTDFLIYAEPLKTLYFGAQDETVATKYIMEPHSSNKLKLDVDKTVEYAAYIRYGDGILDSDTGFYDANGRVSLKEEDNVKVTAKIGKADYTNTIVHNNEDILYLNFSNENVAGNTVTITITQGSTTLATMNLYVSPYATTATVAGEKNLTITQEFMTDKTYKITYNKNVDPEDIRVNFQYKKITDDGEIWKNYPDANDNFAFDWEAKTITIKANPAMDLEDNVSVTGLPPMRVVFYDTTAQNYNKTNVDEGGLDGQFAIKTINVTMKNIEGLTPSAKLISATDLGLNLSIDGHKTYSNYMDGEYLFHDNGDDTFTGLYYVVKATAVDGNRPDPMIHSNIKVYKATGYTTNVYMPLATSTVAGEGHAWKYDVTVQAVYGKNVAETLTGFSAVKQYAISKIRTLKNLATKEPYHETNIGVSAKTNKIYKGQKNVYVAQAKFSSKTTFYDLYIELRDSNNLPVIDNASKGGISTGTNPADIFIDDTSVAELPVGKYTLYVYSRTAAKPATVGVEIYQSIDDSNFEVVIPSAELYKKTNSTASMTASVKYSDPLPKTRKVTWSIEKHPSCSIGFDITKYVSINSSNGRITVAKGFTQKVKLEDNQFKVVATAADYKSDTARTKSQIVTIVSDYSEINYLTLHKDDTQIPLNIKNQYSLFSTEFNKLKINGSAELSNCEIKSSNTKVVKIGAVAGDGGSVELIPVGVGKTRITVKCLDGGNKSASIDLQVKAQRYTTPLKVSLNEVVLDNEDPNTLEITDVYAAEIKVVANDDGDELTNLTNYSLSVSGGAKIITNNLVDPAVKLLIVTGSTFRITLTDNTRKRNEFGYKQVFEIKNMDYDFDEKGKAITKNVGVGLSTSNVKPGLASSIKVTGISSTDTATYSVEIRPDLMTEAYSSAEKAEKYTALLNSRVQSPELEYTLRYDPTYKAFVPESEPEQSFKLKTGEGFEAIPGKYSFAALVKRDECVVCTKYFNVTVAAADKPKFDIYDNYKISIINGTKSVAIEPKLTACANMYNQPKDGAPVAGEGKSFTIDGIYSSSNNGEIKYDFDKYFDWNLVDGKYVIKLKDTVTDSEILAELLEKSVYANVQYSYYDNAGQRYTGSKRITIVTKR